MLQKCNIVTIYAPYTSLQYKHMCVCKKWLANLLIPLFLTKFASIEVKYCL